MLAILTCFIPPRSLFQMSEPAFDQLRTKEQLGYIVFTGLKRLNQQYLALHMIVQSSHKDADYLDGRVESFLQQVWKRAVLRGAVLRGSPCTVFVGLRALLLSHRVSVVVPFA